MMLFCGGQSHFKLFTMIRNACSYQNKHENGSEVDTSPTCQSLCYVINTLNDNK